ncbi:MAG: phosphoribosylamine--glycine ligase [Lentisphaerae bacterium]|nr:phosphoribosylamine--glycine ligase [Lentisphaerota bacterium]
MKILVIGGGGREHTLAWKIAHDSSSPEVFCAPGNAGTAAVATNVPIAAEDVDALTAWAVTNRPDLVVVGPEAPLCAGITDRLEAEGLRVFGPSAKAAQMEGSKEFAKDIMLAAKVPTAEAETFTGKEGALAYVRRKGTPIVIKADGLAAGKGVYICMTEEEAEQALTEICLERRHGNSGNRVVVEEFMEGEEASILALVDGDHIVMLSSSQDHKRVFNNDQGPNTGGMGAYSPAPVVTDDLWPIIHDQILRPTVDELKRRGIVYKGVLYAGLMMTATGPRVLEYNCRFGDPETQVVLPRIEGDILPLFQACVDGTLSNDLLSWKDEACVCVVMASGGYPGVYAKGMAVHGLETVETQPGVVVFHAGTAIQEGTTVTSGGRVLGVTALGATLPEAVKRVYLALSHVTFDQAQYRTDIASRALQRVE